MKTNDTTRASAGAGLRDVGAQDGHVVMDLDMRDLEFVSGGMSGGHAGEAVQFAVIKIKAK